jgi:hypothetical protein
MIKKRTMKEITTDTAGTEALIAESELIWE